MNELNNTLQEIGQSLVKFLPLLIIIATLLIIGALSVLILGNNNPVEKEVEQIIQTEAAISS